MSFRPTPAAFTTLAAFLLPALALWVPSGYSYGALLLLLAALWQAPVWIRRKPDRQTLMLALLLAAMGGMWFLLSLDVGAARWDKGIKWILGIPCLLFAVAYPPHPRAFIIGLPIGCIGMGALALWQTWGLGIPRAFGYTNAIQWGNLALLLGCMALACTVIFWHQRRWPWRVLMGFAVVLAMTASLLSQSRGGWLALILVLPLGLWWVRRLQPQWFMRSLGITAVLVAVLATVLVATPKLHARIDLAAQEINGYLAYDEGETSLGVRLQQYQLAADMISRKPWLGWGAHGFVDEMRRQVDAGTYTEALVHYPEIHNILMDAWVKVGVLGALLQLGLFAGVLYMFWPGRLRLAHHEEGSPAWCTALALCAMGTLLPVCYLVFGMSQPFFNHNSGIMPFVFYVTVLWAALRDMDRGPCAGSAAGSYP